MIPGKDTFPTSAGSDPGTIGSALGTDADVVQGDPSIAEVGEQQGFDWLNKTKGNPIKPLPGGDIRSQCGVLSRQARDAFREACESPDQDTAEVGYASALQSIQELWEVAKFRDRPFRDLLGAIEAALRHHSITQFAPAQRDALRAAFKDLVRWHLDDSIVEDHLSSFLEHDITILAPLVPVGEKRVRITFTELE